MKLDLASELEDLEREKVESGLYRDASEVVAEALRLLDRIDQGPPAKREALRTAIQIGLSDVVESRYATLSDESELRAFFDALRPTP